MVTVPNHSLPDDIVKSRQSWFWRRTTLQLTLIAFWILLGVSVVLGGAQTGNWPTAVVQLGLMGGMTWLVTLYFAMVDSADKVTRLITETGKAIAEAKDAS